MNEFHNSVIRNLPIGAEVISEEEIHFRVWVPRSKSVEVIIAEHIDMQEVRSSSLEAEGNGYFSGKIKNVRAGYFYKYKLDSGIFPDPASRFQPGGPHGPSQIIDPNSYTWRDQEWTGIVPINQVIYEMHVGTFSFEGTFKSIIHHLPHLVELGITIIQMMPIADFPGRYGWGYDGVNLFAPSRLYGTPDDLRELIDTAHEHGIGIILDVVYNHLGPDGNYLKEFSPDYFSKDYGNEWGEAINFDGENSGPVREFFLTNTIYWIREFHFDGFRIDATQQIFDKSPDHIIKQIGEVARKVAQPRSIFIVGENEPQKGMLARPIENGGFGLDALCNDDFHHAAIVALTGRKEAYYTDYNGSSQEFVSIAKWGYLYQGQYYLWQKNPRGEPSFDLEPSNFINFTQNHDQIANSLRGERIHSIGSPGAVRAITAFLLLGPATPMLFQGQEFSASTLFLYFADHNPELAKLVAAGREEFLKQFPSLAHPEAVKVLQNPENIETFIKCKLNFAEKEDHRSVFDFHRDLIQLRRSDPVIGQAKKGSVDGAILNNECFLLRYFGDSGDDRLLVVNLGKELHLGVVPEPLWAPPLNKKWKQLWYSEDLCYGGAGMPSLNLAAIWPIPGQIAVLLTAVSYEED